MRKKNLAFCFGIALLALGLVFGPSMARATVLSDGLQWTLSGPDVTNPGTQTRTIAEGVGESVGETIDFDFSVDPSTTVFGSLNNEVVYLVEPGANVVFNSDGTVTGYRSDKLTFHVNSEVGGGSISITMNSDQDPGTHDTVTGVLETGTPQDLTSNFFGGIDLGSYNTTVKAMSDVEAAVPEPTTLLLVGLGLVGLAGFKKRFRTN